MSVGRLGKIPSFFLKDSLQTLPLVIIYFNDKACLLFFHNTSRQPI